MMRWLMRAALWFGGMVIFLGLIGTVGIGVSWLALGTTWAGIIFVLRHTSAVRREETP